MIDSLLQQIPDGLLQKLVEARPYLERTGGSIQERKRDGVYCLRIRVDDPDRGRVHKRIKLGDDSVAYDTQVLIDRWRREYDDQQAEEERQREEERVYAATVKKLKAAFVDQAVGPSQRRRFAREFNKAAEDPAKLYAFLISGGGSRHLPGRPGPKPRGGLC